MKKPAPLIQKILFGLLSCVMVLPLAQHFTQVIESGKLNGDIHNHPNIAFSWAGWWTGSYQKDKELYLRDSVGFEPDFIRINNQLDYTLYHKANSKDMVIGTHNHYYGGAHIRALYGDDFKGSAYYDLYFRKLAYVRRHLNGLGKELIFVVGASPARTFPENIPFPWRDCTRNDSTNLYLVNKLANQYNVPLIDCSTWFAQIQDTATCKPMAPRAFHWTLAGAARMADSLQRHLQFYLKEPIVQIHIQSAEGTPTARETDNDIEQGLNLIQLPRQDFSYCYPDITYEREGRRSIRTTFIADSYFWPLLATGIPDNVYDNWEFVYYTMEIWRKGQNGARSLHEDHFYDHWEEADALIILCGELNLSNSDWGFVNQVYEQLKLDEIHLDNPSMQADQIAVTGGELTQAGPFWGFTEQLYKMLQHARLTKAAQVRKH